jgi:hypothetical protein
MIRLALAQTLGIVGRLFLPLGEYLAARDAAMAAAKLRHPAGSDLPDAERARLARQRELADLEWAWRLPAAQREDS